MATSTNDSANEAEVSNVEVEAKTSEKTFTEEQVNRLIQKRVNELNESNAKKNQSAINEAIAEFERKQKMTEDERLNEERKAKVEELDRKEKEITLRENRADAIEILASKNIDTKLAEFVVDIDHEKMDSRIKTLEKVFNDAVSKSVESRLKGKTPTDFGDGTKDKVSSSKSLNGSGYQSGKMTAF